MATKKAPGDGLATRVMTLEQRVTALEAGRPGRKAKPMLAIRESGVCALDPDRDSASCPDASIFRYQMGCHGLACKGKQHDAYMRRKTKKTAASGNGAVKPKRKTAPAKAPAKVTARKAAKKVDLGAEVTKAAAKRPTKKAAAKRAAPSKRVAVSA